MNQSPVAHTIAKPKRNAKIILILCQKSVRNRGIIYTLIKKEQAEKACSLYGAADRGRTDTVSLPQDFESSASANSTTAACHQLVYYNTLCFKNQPFFSIFLNFFKKILKANTAKGFKAALAQKICLKIKFQTCTK